MKATLFPLLFFAAGTLCVSAQLEMPDSAQMASGTETEAPAQPEVRSRYYTPSKSYKSERNNIRRGNSLFEKDKFYEALEAYDKALEENGSSIRAKYNKAVTLLQLQNDDNKGTEKDPRVQAAQLFSELLGDALQYDKDIAERTFYNMGNIAFNDEKYDQSIESYKSALRLNPSDMNARENLRLAQLKKQEQEQNQDQDKQNQNEDQKEQEQQQQQNQDQQEQQEQQQPQQQPMTNSAQQILQTMQNKENATRKKVQAKEEPAQGRPQTDKPW